MVRYLVEKEGADVNSLRVRGSDPGNTPLHEAAFGGHYATASYLLGKGANVNVSIQEFHIHYKVLTTYCLAQQQLAFFTYM